MIIQVGANRLDCDVEATRAAFSDYIPNLPWTCDCAGCRNYRVARELIYTEPVLNFFSQFGIDTTKPSEIYEGGLVGETFECGGWFHFVGTIVQSGHDGIDTRIVITPGAVDISDIVKVDFRDTMLGLVPVSFRGKPLVQLECWFKIPWLLPVPRP